MLRRPPRLTRTETLVPDTRAFRANRPCSFAARGVGGVAPTYGSAGSTGYIGVGRGYIPDGFWRDPNVAGRRGRSPDLRPWVPSGAVRDRKSKRLNSSH